MFYDIQKTTLVDYPGEVATTLFTGGCNMLCPFCHNPELIQINGQIPIKWQVIFDFLKKRSNVLGGVCITGGEPLLYELGEVIKDIHSLGLKVKIDTNGTFPQKLIKLNVDYIAMDIKTSLEKYRMLGYNGEKEISEQIKGSIDYIITSNIDHEFRTTVVPGIVTINDIKEIVQLIVGAKKYVLAQFRPKNTFDKGYEKITPYPINVLEEMGTIIKETNIPYEIRANY